MFYYVNVCSVKGELLRSAKGVLMLLGVHDYENFDDGVNINKVILTLII